MVSGEIFHHPHQVVPGPVVVIRRGLVFFTPIAGQNLIVNGRTHAAFAMITQNDSMKKSLARGPIYKYVTWWGVGVCISSTHRDLVVYNVFVRPPD